MKRKGKKLAPRLALDMSFEEALSRFVATKPKEVEASIKRAKKKQPPQEAILRRPSRKKPPKSRITRPSDG